MATKSKMSTAKPTLIEVLARASEDDLADVREQIVTAQKHLDSLKAIEKVLDCKLHGKPVRKSPARRPIPAGGQVRTSRTTERLSDAIYQVIDEQGSKSISGVAVRLGVSDQAVRIAVSKSNGRLAADGSGMITIRK